MAQNENLLKKKLEAAEAGYIIIESPSPTALEETVNLWISSHNLRPSGGICYARGEFYQALIRNDGHFSLGTVEQKASDAIEKGKRKKKK